MKNIVQNIALLSKKNDVLHDVLGFRKSTQKQRPDMLSVDNSTIWARNKECFVRLLFRVNVLTHWSQMKGLISVCVSMWVCKLATRVQAFAFVILLRHVCPHLYLKTWYEKVSLTFFFIPALAPFPRSKHGYSRIQVVMNTPKNTCLICIPLLGLAVCRPALA